MIPRFRRKTPLSLSCYLGVSALLALISPAWAGTEKFFTPPEAPFAVKLNENIVAVRLPSGPAEAAQGAIDATRKDHPEALLSLEAQGTIQIGAKPLKLGSRMMLKLSPTAGVAAAPDCSATALVEMADVDTVSVTSSGPGVALLDGMGKPVTGIRVVGGKRIHLDQLSVVACRVAGIDYQGADPTAVNETGSVTRCDFRDNGDGLHVGNTAGFMCLDNEFKSQSDTALTIHSLTSVVAGNQFDENHSAIRSGSSRGVIARNRINDADAIQLTASSEGNLITENHGKSSGITLTLAGSGHQLVRNALSGSATLAAGSKDILLVGNEGLQCDAAAPGLKWFNPPTWDHPHQEARIVDGMGRFDLEVLGGISKTPKTAKPVPVDLKVVQKELDRARSEHPADVIVLKMQGKYVSRNPKGLKLPPNTCVILDGQIVASLGTESDPLWVREAPLTQLIQLPATGFCSISGGKLDGNHQAFFPINANTGSTALIEGVNLTAGARDGLYTKGRDGKAAMFVYRCNVLGNNGRGIWPHVASRVHSIANVCSGNKMDGIDLDAGSKDCTALFNVCSANGRHGVFVEEAVSEQIVFANILNGNGQAGVHVWNEEVVGDTGHNVIAANTCEVNRRGVSAGGRAADTTANANLFFNNVCRQNRLDGALAGNGHGKGNYFAQCVSGQNHESEISSSESAAPHFFSVSPRSATR